MGNKQKNSSQATVLKEKEGNDNKNININDKNYGILEKNHLDYLYVIGKGGFGKVKFVYIIK